MKAVCGSDLPKLAVVGQQLGPAGRVVQLPYTPLALLQPLPDWDSQAAKPQCQIVLLHTEAKCGV
jgi:hypothetical protein